MNNQENQNKLEALLFFKGTSVSKKEAGKILGLDASSLQEAINSLKESYQGKGSLLLVENDEYIEIRLEKEIFDMFTEKEREELGQYFSAKAREILNGSLEIRFDDKLESGFRIGPEDGSYLISFTEKDFQAFFSDYLRPKTKALLYGSN